ncbi:hypothetical protein TcWFU_000430 [Taenia crassiceps]|uniref:Uncharacterized protein n=1 Tax=Taenia crassiceps TaxID=6207 RepID=A0ABR4QAF1_9CEST
MALLRFRAGGQGLLGNGFAPPPPPPPPPPMEPGPGNSAGIDDMYPPPPSLTGPTPPHQQQPMGGGGGVGAQQLPLACPTLQALHSFPSTCSRRCCPRGVV